MAKTNHLTETHDTTLEQADALLARIAQTTLAIRKAEVDAEKRVQKIQADCTKKTAADRAKLAEQEDLLRTFVLGHRSLFSKPRMRVTQSGSYGLTTSTRTVVAAAEKVVAWLKRNGHKDAVKITEKPIAKVLTRLLKGGAKVPGVSLVTGEIHKYELDPAILDEL